MTAHIFVSPEARVLASWRSAFPELSSVPSLAALPPRPGEAVLWLDAERDTWVNDARVLAARGDRVVVLSSAPSSDQAQTALEAGARAYCHAYATPELLREVAVVVRHGGLWVGPELLARMIRAVVPVVPPAPVAAPLAVELDGLSARERAVAAAVAEGLTNKEVALRLDITERTVKAHLAAVFEKVGVRDRLQLALLVSRLPA